jgi:hypothetical protein
VFALGQRLRHFVDRVTTTAGATNGERVQRWFQDKKAGWYAALEDPQMPASRRFSRGSRTCITSSPINVGPSTLASVAWKWKADVYRPATGSSMSKSAPLAGFAER